MNKDNERITYEEFITMFKIAPRMCYTLYEKAEDEIDKLKKQKVDVVEYIKYQLSNLDFEKNEDMKAKMLGSMILVMVEDKRMLGEIDEI